MRKKRWKIMKWKDANFPCLYRHGVFIHFDRLEDCGDYWVLFHDNVDVGTIYKEDNRIVNLDKLPEILK